MSENVINVNFGKAKSIGDFERSVANASTDIAKLRAMHGGFNLRDDDAARAITTANARLAAAFGGLTFSANLRGTMSPDDIEFNREELRRMFAETTTRLAVVASNVSYAAVMQTLFGVELPNLPEPVV